MPNLTAGTIAGRRYNVGDTGPGGGIVYMTPTYQSPYVGLTNTTGQYYECAPATWDGGNIDPQYTFGCYDNEGPHLCPTSSNAIGTGLSNSQCYYNACAARPIAVSKALDLTLNGYSDWFLPSTYEITVLQHQLVDYGNIFGLNLNDFYWGSTDYSPAQASCIYMVDTHKIGAAFVDKYANYWVKPVRSFYARYE